jgi:hypothetical protein
MVNKIKCKNAGAETEKDLVEVNVLEKLAK